MTTSPTIENAMGPWPVSKLRPNPLNPRQELKETGLEELTASIRAQGILQPLLITPNGIVVAGHRRLAAAKRAGLEEVPVIIRELSQAEQQEIMLVENLQRQDLSPVEEGRAFKRLLDAGYTTADVARKIAVTTARINSRVLLLKLDETVQAMFHRGDLPITLAPLLQRIAEPARQRQVATMAIRRELTVPELKRIVERGSGTLNTPPPARSPTLTTMPPFEAGDHDGESAGRKGALGRLDSLSARVLTIADVGAAFRDVCCACGMQDLPEYCAACPMVQLVDTLVARVAPPAASPEEIRAALAVDAHFKDLVHAG